VPPACHPLATLLAQWISSSNRTVEILGPVSVDYLLPRACCLTKKESTTKQTATARLFYKQAYAVTGKTAFAADSPFAQFALVQIRGSPTLRKCSQRGLRASVAWLRALIVAKVRTGPALN
jgi:hypothetical protein